MLAAILRHLPIISFNKNLMLVLVREAPIPELLTEKDRPSQSGSFQFIHTWIRDRKVFDRKTTAALFSPHTRIWYWPRYAWWLHFLKAPHPCSFSMQINTTQTLPSMYSYNTPQHLWSLTSKDYLIPTLAPSNSKNLKPLPPVICSD